MGRHLEREIDGLKRKSLALAAVVEENFDKALAAVRTRDGELAAEVMGSDDGIDEAEVAVEEDCLKILALHQPVAHDLRVIVAILKVNNELERIGDLAVNIAKCADSLEPGGPSAPQMLLEMAGHARAMVRDSLDALVNLDQAVALDVCRRDDEVDDLHKQFYSHVASAIEERPGYAAHYIRLLSVARCVERIADHVTNICEDVIYTVSGEIIRHRGAPS